MCEPYVTIMREIESDPNSFALLVIASWCGKTADELERLQARVAALEGVLYRSGFVRCDIPACNCGSWHQTGGFAARFKEIDEATEDFWRNGETLLDRVKRMAAQA
jgi:hypothetical protein